MALVHYDEGISMSLASPESSEKLKTLSSIADMGESGAAYAAEVASLLRDRDDLVVLGACEALGQMGYAGLEQAEGLRKLLESGSEKKKCFAAGALGMMGPGAARYAESVASNLPTANSNVKAACVIALGSMKAETFAKEVGSCLEDASPAVVNGAITALTLLDGGGQADFASAVSRKLGDPSAEIKASAVMYFAKFSDSALAHGEAICSLLKDGDVAVRQAVVSVFQQLGAKAEPLLASVGKCLTEAEAEPSCKASAALALGAIGPAAAAKAPTVAELLKDTSEDTSQLVYCVAGIQTRAPTAMAAPACAAASALASMGATAQAPEIAALLGSPSMDVRIAAIAALGELGAKFEDSIMPALEDPRANVRAAACSALGAIARKGKAEAGVVSKVTLALEDRSPVVREAAVAALGAMGEEAASPIDAIKDMMEKDRALAVRVAAIKALGSVGLKGQVYASDVCRCVYDEFTDIRIAAIQALSEMGERGASFADEVAEAVSDPDPAIRAASLESLGKMGEAAKAFLATIETAQSDPSPLVREAASGASTALSSGALME